MDDRDATEADRAALESFRCASSGEAYDTEVEAAIRQGLEWRAEHESRRLMVFEDGGEVVCVAAYGEVEPNVVWIYFLGVAEGRQGGGLGGEAFKAIVGRVSTDVPVRLGWWVDRNNVYSQRMCQKLGFNEWDIDPMARHYRTYRAWV